MYAKGYNVWEDLGSQGKLGPGMQALYDKEKAKESKRLESKNYSVDSSDPDLKDSIISGVSMPDPIEKKKLKPKDKRPPWLVRQLVFDALDKGITTYAEYNSEIENGAEKVSVNLWYKYRAEWSKGQWIKNNNQAKNEQVVAKPVKYPSSVSRKIIYEALTNGILNWSDFRYIHSEHVGKIAESFWYRCKAEWSKLPESERSQYLAVQVGSDDSEIKIASTNNLNKNGETIILGKTHTVEVTLDYDNNMSASIVEINDQNELGPESVQSIDPETEEILMDIKPNILEKVKVIAKFNQIEIEEVLIKIVEQYFN
ncbi:MAG: hypothetical protein OHK0017_07980 [Patescibacteria group bacterium]